MTTPVTPAPSRNDGNARSARARGGVGRQQLALQRASDRPAAATPWKSASTWRPGVAWTVTCATRWTSRCCWRNRRPRCCRWCPCRQSAPRRAGAGGGQHHDHGIDGVDELAHRLIRLFRKACPPAWPAATGRPARSATAAAGLQDIVEIQESQDDGRDPGPAGVGAGLAPPTDDFSAASSGRLNHSANCAPDTGEDADQPVRPRPARA